MQPQIIITLNMDKWRIFLLKLGNNLIVLGVITPLVVAFWNSSFAFGSLYIYPERPKLRAIILTAIGFICAALLCLFLHYLKKSNEILWRLLLYPISLVSVSSWVGVWTLWDSYSGTSLKSNVSSHFIGMIILWLNCTSCSILCSPFVVGLDRFLKDFHYYTRFEHHNNTSLLFTIFDLITTVLCTGVGVITFWRGTWGIMDNLLFPQDLVLSASVSVVSGYTIAVICFCVCKDYQHFTLNQARIVRHFLECLWIYISGIATVFSWRGIWYLYDAFIFPDSVETRSLVLHVVAVLGLYCGRCYSCVIASPGLGCTAGFDGSKYLHGLNMGHLLSFEQLPLIEDAIVIEPQDRGNETDLEDYGSDRETLSHLPRLTIPGNNQVTPI